jgi:hypothetical protein
MLQFFTFKTLIPNVCIVTVWYYYHQNILLIWKFVIKYKTAWKITADFIGEFLAFLLKHQNSHPLSRCKPHWHVINFPLFFMHCAQQGSMTFIFFFPGPYLLKWILSFFIHFYERLTIQDASHFLTLCLRILALSEWGGPIQLLS